MHKKLNILHITYDLRDRLNREKTTAVKKLIDISKSYGSISTIDLLRVPFPKEEKIENISENHLVINSFGLPFGIFLIAGLNRAFEKILKARNSELIDLDLVNIIHAHKLTFEGLIGYKLAVRYNKNLIITLRQTDAWIFRRRPDLIKHFKPVIEKSYKIIYLIPYIVNLMRIHLGESYFSEHVQPKLEFLPNIVERRTKPNFEIIPDTVFMTALRMDKRSVKRKNIKRLIKAISLVKNAEFSLVILGNGDYISKVKKWTRSYKIDDKVIFIGNIPNEDMDRYYSNSIAFLLPSLSESFGMVYPESLLNGTPIMYSKNCMGFDGVFDNVGVGVNPISVESIAEGLTDLIQNNSFYRQHIKNLYSNGEFDIFSAEYIKERYFKILDLNITK